MEDDQRASTAYILNMEQGTANLQSLLYEKAVEHFEKAQKAADTPHHRAAALQMKGLCYLMMGDTNQAVTDLSRALAFSGGDSLLRAKILRDLSAAQFERYIAKADATRRGRISADALNCISESIALLEDVDSDEYYTSIGFKGAMIKELGHSGGIKMLRGANAHLRMGNNRTYEFNNLIRLMRFSGIERLKYLPRAIRLTRTLDQNGNPAGQLSRVVAVLLGNKGYRLMKQLKQRKQ